MRKTQDYLRASGSGCLITVDASPGASKTEVAGVNEWRGALQIRIAARPMEGAANEELISFLSERFSIAKSSIRIVKGERSSLKTVMVPLPVEKVRAVLGGV